MEIEGDRSRRRRSAGGPLPSFIALYALLYCSFGAASPFMPSFIASRGVTPEWIGVIFSAATAVRLASAPLAGMIADRTDSLRLTLALFAIASAVVGALYLPARGFAPILAIALLHALTIAPLTNLADALALVVSRLGQQGGGFEYGIVRGAGSAAFIAGSMLGGFAVARSGLDAIVLTQSALLLCVPLAAFLIAKPNAPAVGAGGAAVPSRSIRRLLELRDFRRITLVAALVLGSHAMHDTFAVIRWIEAGIQPQTVPMLWSLAVVSEVIVFFALGPRLLARMSPASCIALAAVAGVVRWSVAALTVDILAIVLIQPLHGLTFALLHLASMRLLARLVPDELSATGIAIYGTIGAGLSGVLMTLLAGRLYAEAGQHGFAVMAALCAMAIPVALRLPRTDRARLRSR